MDVPIVIYGATDCDDTERTRALLSARGVAFSEVNIDHDPEAERFVIFVNRGFRSTPTLLIGADKLRLLATEPTNEQLDRLLDQARDMSR